MFIRRPNIAVAGLTAAGKTTHAKLIAQKLDYQYVSATEILLELVGIESSGDRAWFDHGNRIRQARASDDVDAELDRRLVQIATECEGLVIDSWAIAWTCHASMIRIWLESDTTSRAWKCFVSQGDTPEHDLVGCDRLIENKDVSTRRIFMDRHGFDLFTDHDVFDAVLDNTYLIRQPTRWAADSGIAEFEPVVSAVVEFLIDNRPDTLASAVNDWTADQRTCLTYVNGWSDDAS